MNSKKLSVYQKNKIKSESVIREERRIQMKKFADSMTAKQALEFLVDTGICTPKGNYTKVFR